MDHWTFSIDKTQVSKRVCETKDSNNQLIPVGVAIEILMPGAIKAGKKQQDREREKKKKKKIGPLIAK